MTKGLTQKMRAWVLWEAGFRSASSMERCGKISERSARRYITEFQSGGGWERNEYSPRTKTKQTPKVAKKVIQKAKCRRKVYTSREIGASVGISHTQVQKILKFHGISYKSIKRKIPLTAPRKAERVRFARSMRNKKPDWKRTFITDEASFWLNKAKPKKVWTDELENESVGDVHGPKIHC